MQCLFCQNYDISRTTDSVLGRSVDLDELITMIEAHLDSGCRSVGFVSPSHYLPQMFKIIDTLHARNHHPVFIYNTNGYDKLEAIQAMDGIIDVYLPDFKYMDEKLARTFSDTPHYPETTAVAIGEMFRQTGADIKLDDEGLITRGMIIRHLVLPGQVANSKAVLLYIAEHFSTDCYISLMSQYYPTPLVAKHPELGRCITAEEYDEVLNEFDRLGFHRGWVQELESSHTYRPQFMKDHPFE
jgi:putative pyruvate formate lyase activating enzyme